MPVYRKARSRYRVVVFHRGQRRDWIVEGTRQDAEAFEARQRRELEAQHPSAVLRTAPGFESFCVAHYRPHAELRLAPSTWYRQEFLLENLIEFFGETKLTEITDADVDRYARRRLAAGLLPVSVNNELRVLRRVQSFARERHVPVGAFGVRQLDEPERRPKVWSGEQLSALLAACELEAPEILPLVVFLLNTGCRKGEALALRWDSVDLERREVRIWPSVEWRPKSNRPREIPISDALLPWLEGPRRSEEWVFPTTRKNRRRFTTWPKLQWERACKAAGLDGGPHRLRHTFASHFLARVPDLGVLAAVLGHSDEAVSRLYAWMLPDRLARARNAVSIHAEIGPAKLAAKLKWQGSGKG